MDRIIWFNLFHRKRRKFFIIYKVQSVVVIDHVKTVENRKNGRQRAVSTVDRVWISFPDINRIPVNIQYPDV